jgi:integrase
LIEAAPEPLATYLRALFLTGCRPNELAEATAADLDAQARTLQIKNKTRRRDGRPTRTVYLNPEAPTLLKRAARQHPTGPLLRAAKGGPWTENARRKTFDKVRAEVGTAETLDTFRAGWVTDALAAGISPALVAELAGHSTLIMMRHYARLSDKSDALRAAAAAVRPGAMSAKRRSPRSR